jgi:hypothetical protein
VIAVAQAVFDECDDSLSCLGDRTALVWLVPAWLATMAVIWTASMALRRSSLRLRPLPYLVWLALSLVLPPVAAGGAVLLLSATGLQLLHPIGYAAVAVLIMVSAWLASAAPSADANPESLPQAHDPG